MRLIKNAFSAGFLAAALTGIACFSSCAKSGAVNGKTAQYQFTTITKGSVEKTISATGSLEPTSTVTVRSPVSSTVEAVYVDYNSVVKKGDKLASLKTDTLQNQYDLAKISYQIDLTSYNNEKALYDKKLASTKELNDAYSTMYSAKVTMDNALTSLNDATITSPIDGIILTKDVSVGDTVTGNSNTTGTQMFTLAQNLKDMEIEAGVGESDIASIYIGMPVRFSLEALPGKTYQGTVKNRYLMPTTTNNVNSYTVVVSADNSDSSLFPGMTCSVEFIVETNTDVLTVTNAALRYEPSWMTDDEITAAEKAASEANMTEAQKAALAAAEKSGTTAKASGGDAGSGGPGLGGMIPGVGGMERRIGGGSFRPGGSSSGSSGSQKSSTAASAWTKKYLWYLDSDNKLSCIEVMAGTSDGTKTMIKAPDNSTLNLENLKVITREKVAA